jgi:hypothetical protein
VKPLGYPIAGLAADVDIEHGRIGPIMIKDRERLMQVHARVYPASELSQEVRHREVDKSLILQQQDADAVQSGLG